MAVPVGLKSSPRTLVLTHLRPREASLEPCRRLWDLNDQAFVGGRPFTRRLSLVEEGSLLPDVDDFSALDAKIFSWSGRIDDPTIPPGLQRFVDDLVPPVIPASARGFAASGDNYFIFGGGNLDYCLFRTISSVIELKIKQKEPLYAAVPLVLTYFSGQVKDPFAYIKNPAQYIDYLTAANQRGAIGEFDLRVDGKTLFKRSGPGPLILLDFYTVFRRLLASPVFFPELADPSALLRVFANFQYNKE